MKLEDLEKLMQELYYTPDDRTKELVIYTGYEGMLEFHIAFLFQDGRVSMEVCKRKHREDPTRLPDVFIFSLFKKSGIYKVVLNLQHHDYPYIIRKGTKIWGTYRSIVEVNKAIKRLNYQVTNRRVSETD